MDHEEPEEEEISEDKDDEKYNQEHSESFSDNADTPEDLQGEKRKRKEITWSSSPYGRQGCNDSTCKDQDDPQAY